MVVLLRIHDDGDVRMRINPFRGYGGAGALKAG